MSLEFIVLAAAMGLVTYLPRWLPVFFLSRRQLPEWFVEWLDLIPAAILSALIFAELFVTPDPRHVKLLNVKSIVAIPTLLFALKTKSLGGSVVFGMLLFWLLEKHFQ